VDAYHEHMCEALSALRSGLRCLDEALLIQEKEDLERQELLLAAGMRCRYAFLLAAMVFEAAGNALLLGLDSSRSLYEDLERLQTLLKFELVCLAHGKKFDRSNALYARVLDVVKCRNEFVHPKPRKAALQVTPDRFDDLEIIVSKTKVRGYPTAFTLFQPAHARAAIGDILAFVSWVVFDVCGLTLEDGSMQLGLGSRGYTGDVTLLAHEYGFDVRSFGPEAVACHVITIPR